MRGLGVTVNVVVDGPERLKPKVVNCRDGTYRISYVVKVRGLYDIMVCYCVVGVCCWCGCCGWC